VYFPQIAELLPQDAAPQEAVPHGVGRILFVDDEAAVRDVTQEWLTHLGYETVVRANGREALETFQANPQLFDLVITDYTMPDMTGVTLTQEIQRLRPGIPIVLCTGFHQVMDSEPIQALGLTAFLLKPFTLKDLGVTIQRILP
jgi:CheY-like chemotaxis protein